LVGPILVDAVGPCLSLHRLSMKLPGNSRAGGQGCEPFPVSAARGEAPSTIGRSELLPGHPIECAGWLRDFVLGTASLQPQRRSRSRHGHHHNGCEAKSGWERSDHTVRSDRSRSITSGFTATGYRDLYVGMGWEVLVFWMVALVP